MLRSAFPTIAGLSCSPEGGTGELPEGCLRKVEGRGGGQGDGTPRIQGLLSCAWDSTLGGAEQGSPREKKGAPSPLSGMCAAPTPTPGGPGAACSAILMLSAGLRCGEHPYATLLRGLRVASNHGHLLTWHRAQAQSLGNRARQRLVLRRAPQTGRGPLLLEVPRGSRRTKDRFFFP